MTTVQEAIFKAVESNDLNKLRILLDLEGADPNNKNTYGVTPLHIASAKGHSDIVGILIDYNADINFQISLGWTPLHCACQNNQKEVVTMLLDKNASSNLPDIFGHTPLDLALKNYHYEIVAILVMHINKQQEATIQELRSKLQQIQDIIKTQ